MNRISMVMEAVWIVLSGFCLVIGVYATIKTGFSTSYMFFALAVVAFLMFLLRRFRRKKLFSDQTS